MVAFSYRIFNVQGNKMVAISDSSIVGKSFEDGKLQLHVSRDFYSDKTCQREDIKKIIGGANIVNAVGKDIIGLMIKHKMVDKDNVLIVGGVPHAQVITM